MRAALPLLQHDLVVRQEGAVEIKRRVRIRLELVDRFGLFDGLCHAVRIDIAHSVCLHGVGQDIGVDGHLQTLGFERRVCRRIALDEAFNGAGRIRDRVFPAHANGLDETGDELGIFLGEVGVHQNGIAIERDAMVAHQENALVFHRDAEPFQVERRGEGEAGYSRDLSFRQHRFTRGKADRLDGDRVHVQAVLGGEDRELCPGAVRRRRAQHLAFEVLRRFNAERLAPDHSKRRLVVNHHHRSNRRTRVLVEETHQRIDVGKADRKRAGRDFRNGIERASAFGNFHRKAFAFEIALVDGDEVGCGGTLELPVEGEIDFFLGESAGGKGRDHGGCGK